MTGYRKGPLSPLLLAESAPNGLTRSHEDPGQFVRLAEQFGDLRRRHEFDINRKFEPERSLVALFNDGPELRPKVRV